MSSSGTINFSRLFITYEIEGDQVTIAGPSPMGPPQTFAYGLKVGSAFVQIWGPDRFQLAWRDPNNSSQDLQMMVIAFKDYVAAPGQGTEYPPPSVTEEGVWPSIFQNYFF